MTPEEQTNQIPNQPRKKRDLLYDTYSLLHDLLYILAAVTVIFLFAVRLVGVKGDSMFSTLHNGDYLMLQNNFLCGGYDRGDIVVAAVPTFSNGEPIVKRVIATEGQTVDVVYSEAGLGQVYVDGAPLDEPYIYETMNNTICSDFSQHVTVPEGCLFLMGDNRNHSTDSRYIGCVDERYVLGKVLFITMPGDNSDGRHRGGGREWSRIGFGGLQDE